MSTEIKKYFAFISYNSRDLRWGKRLQRKLEHYRMPATLCSEKGWERTPIRPVFFAPTDIQPGGLTSEIHERLRASRNLIVICSPNSARSEWVGKEIAFFHEIGRTRNIHFFIVDGAPHSGNPDTECFNPVVKELGLPEILGANIHEKIFRLGWLNRERAYVQLISKLLDVEFDSIWKRHRRILTQKIIAWVMALALILLSVAGVWAGSRPVDVTLRLDETSYHNDQLPPIKDAVVTLELDNEVKTGTINSLDDSLIFTNIPHKFLNRPVRVGVKARNYHDVDTMAILRQEMHLNMCRDSSVYGNVRFRIWNQEQGKYMGGQHVVIAGKEVCSDADGMISIYVPLREQRTMYHVVSHLHMECDTVYMPCGKNDVILIK